MGKVRDFFLGAPELEVFNAEPEIYDGEIITTVDQRLRMLFNGSVTASVKDALSIPAILRGRNLICNISTLPLVTVRGNYEVVDNYFLRQIDPNVPNGKVIADTIQDLLFYGKAYWYIDVFDSKDYPLRAHHLDYQDVTLDEQGSYWVDGKRVDFNRIRDFHSTNPALLSTIAGSIERAKYLFQASAMYAKHPTPKLLVTPKADVDPDPEQVREAMQSLADSAAESPYVYAGAAVELKALQVMSPEELQLIESLKLVALDFANALGIDAEDLGISTTSRTYQNAVDRRKDRVNDVLNIYMQAISSRLSMGDITPGGYSVRFDQDDYLRADPLTRMQVYTGYLAQGVLTVDEVRAKEGLPPMTAEQKALVKPVPATDLRANFSGESEAEFTTGEFAGFDKDRRTVRVLAVPYGEVSSLKNGRKFVFTKGSIELPADLKQVKLLRDHDYTQSVGFATTVEDTDAGLVVTFKITERPEGDVSIACFTDGTYDGVSIGVDFNENGTYSERGKPGINYVRSARLNEVSQVSMPAFKNARALTVTASRQGDNMTDNLDGAVNEAPEKTYTLAEIQSMQTMFNKSQTVPASVQDDPNVAPAITKSNEQEKPVAFVSEPGPYRFDGGSSDFEFSSDIISMNRGDGSAKNRVMEFLQAEFAVATSNVTTLNPTIQKPGMYVDQLDYATPIWNTIAKGTPPNGVNPFAFPKFSSASGLVSDHVEGTEPTLGAFATTNQTVTPTALSGKIEVNREAWDMGGSPALSTLIRNEMHRAYREGLETAAAAFLDAQSFTTITLATAGADSALEGALISALVDLQGARGGYRLTDFLVQADLYKALVLAKDSTGRRLFPALGPNNATGTVGRNFSTLDLNGLPAKYAWALGASGVVAEKSYLMAPEDVHGWATAPQDLTFDIQVKSIYLAVWGYKAFAVSRNEGVRTFSYDPVA